jgi:hypothetical protein
LGSIPYQTTRLFGTGARPGTEARIHKGLRN